MISQFFYTNSYILDTSTKGEGVGWPNFKTNMIVLTQDCASGFMGLGRILILVILSDPDSGFQLDCPGSEEKNSSKITSENFLKSKISFQVASGFCQFPAQKKEKNPDSDNLTPDPVPKYCDLDNIQNIT